MNRRIGSEDFKSASPFEQDADSGGFQWAVYGDYEIAKEDERLPHFTASSHKPETYYRPLVDSPHLFLEFARLAERSGRSDEGLDNWIRKYGLLGLSSQRLDRPLEQNSVLEFRTLEQTVLEIGPDVDWAFNADLYPDVIAPPFWYSAAGGPGDTLDAYRLEVAKINKLLTLYEALLNRDFRSLETYFALHERCTPDDLRKKWRAGLDKSIVAELDKSIVEDISRPRDLTIVGVDLMDDGFFYPTVPGDWNVHLMKRAIVEIWVTVGSALSVFAHPAITYQQKPNPTSWALSPDKLTSTWRVRNLLGAIYLQFFWLITSMSELSRCKYCDRIISYAPPMPESDGRKPRKDKEFCDSRCRQNYHYHNRIKPKRVSE